MKLLRAFVLTVTAAAVMASQASAALACEDHQPAAVAAPRSSTAKYHSLEVAKKNGYSILADTAGITCIAEPEMGAMGVHYVKGDLVKDPSINANQPEALVYAPDSRGRLQLAALEYVVIQSDWLTEHPLPPSLGITSPVAAMQTVPELFGQQFDFTDAPNRYGLPPFYSLHAWIWKDNPAGTFEMWNPDVHCTSS